MESIVGINITIKGLSEEVGNILKSQAKLNHRSLNAEIKNILEKNVAVQKRDPQEILTQIRKHRENLPFSNITPEELIEWKNEGRP